MPIPNMQVGNDAGKPNGTRGDGFFASDTRKLYIHDGTTWRKVGESVGYVTLAGTVSQGQPIGYSSGWVRADADAIIPAQFIAMIDGVSGDLIPVATEMEVSGSSLTAGSPVYLSATAGAITATRPTAAGSLRQNLGAALSTTSAFLRIRPFREIDIPMVPIKYTGAEGDTLDSTALDSSIEVFGYALNAQNEHITFVGRLPDNFVSVVRAPIASAQDAATGGGTAPTISIAVASVADGVSWDSVTPDTSESSKTLSTNAAGDPVQEYDAAAALNATGVAVPGAWIFMDLLKSDAGTVETLVFGARMTVLVTD